MRQQQEQQQHSNQIDTELARDNCRLQSRGNKRKTNYRIYESENNSREQEQVKNSNRKNNNSNSYHYNKEQIANSKQQQQQQQTQRANRVCFPPKTRRFLQLSSFMFNRVQSWYPQNAKHNNCFYDFMFKSMMIVHKWYFILH